MKLHIKFNSRSNDAKALWHVFEPIPNTLSFRCFDHWDRGAEWHVVLIPYQDTAQDVPGSASTHASHAAPRLPPPPPSKRRKAIGASH